MQPRHRALVLLCALALGCQASGPLSPAIVEVAAPLPKIVEPVATMAHATAAKSGPQPCKPVHHRYSCKKFNGCQPTGSTTKERECWVKLYAGMDPGSMDLQEEYDLPCSLLEVAEENEQLAAMEADRVRKVQPTLPGLAAVALRHADAWTEQAAAARALAKAVQDGSERPVIAAARARVDAATARLQREWVQLSEICHPY